ncbi:Adenosine/AMP deaminase domain-containing protein [Cardiosporidium cionae]|uniref:Adenosine deaminase n=1 Tax=Cardiosporidium cionae TaxID=476202 RepID=A0ABQ7J527_9APIC|nr:Adenosine/AMP deaminase domain-containing protein [Cardiosporidium cionae]|eukprot:KAF8817881.1 Adenosine/AMP deaminase domain-containing protein [Cardiosporidium cionae]
MAVVKETIKKWKSMPKVELHCHLEGSVQLNTILEEYARLKIPIPYDSENENREYFTVEKPVKSLMDFLDKFSRSQKVFSDRLGIQRVAEELVLSKFHDGVKLLEVRYSPCYIQRQNNLSLEEIHEAILAGLECGKQKCDGEIEIGLICIGEAGISEKDLRIAAEFAIKYKEDFVGFDNAGPEINLAQYKCIYDQLHNEGIKITIHAAEDLYTGAAENVLDAVQHLHATRIGHGIQIVRDSEILEKIVEERILLEISPTSNFLTGSVSSIHEHPVRKLYERGVRISINTDDPGMFNCSLSGEYELMSKCLQFSSADFLTMNTWALEASFLNDQVKQRLKEKYFNPTNSEYC